ncbi:Fungal trans [Geosmithia morbida]|uniref:Fungal trans n=1 Tax=Geosmithia morbida TaxID=1094350 RepID=A0A9P5CXV4_9HYPO|nr:Fungal trans [Geosmithia morbida]KAF4119703.1 Fungal trans [Geosmithia morbida]
MDTGPGPGEVSSHINGGDRSGAHQRRQKRSRILLSCAPCRTSKLRCDRQQPCRQCSRKERQDLCEYAPRPEKKRSRPRPTPKNMSTRLKHLEGVVREMMDEDGKLNRPSGQTNGGVGKSIGGWRGGAKKLQGQVIRGQNEVTSYIGETHCMAMLDDVDLKAYFDNSEDEDDSDSPPFSHLEEPDLLMSELGSSSTVTREDLISQLPEKNVMARLVSRYFECLSPSQSKYARFCQNPDSATLHWISQVFMILSMGVYYSQYQAPAEIEQDSAIPPADRVRHYRICAGWALIAGKYMQPDQTTLPAMVLYLGSHLHLNRATQMSSYVLSGLCLRLMLKLGLHRDPDKLAGISPFEGEMRRRLWNQAVILETLVSFHVGLPGMATMIDSDAQLPRNLQDDDFDENTGTLPASRPMSDWTPVTYAALKRGIMAVFGQISRQAHALRSPEYGEVMRLDAELQREWAKVPPLMMVRSTEESIGDHPALVMQRFGISALYNKSRCVLHRRYLADMGPSPRRLHDYSRQQCLDAAVSLLNAQSLIWELSRPGRSLSGHRWFVSSLSVHDYLLAAMVVYYIIQSEHYDNPDSKVVWVDPARSSSLSSSSSSSLSTPPTREHLKGLIYTSYKVWDDLAGTTSEVRRTADTLALILSRLGCPVDRPAQTSPIDADAAARGAAATTGGSVRSRNNIDTATLSGVQDRSEGSFEAALHGRVSSMSLNGEVFLPELMYMPFLEEE